MSFSARAGVFLLVVGGAVSCGGVGSGRQHEVTPSGLKANASTKQLHALFDEAWDHDMREYPVWASTLGDMRNADKWDDVSVAASARRDAYDRDVLAKIKRISRSALSSEDAISYDLFLHKYEEAVEGQAFRLHLLPVNQRGGIQTIDDTSDALPFASLSDYENWNARLRSIATYMDQTIELLTEGAHQGMTHPKIVMQRVVAQIDAQIVDDPTKSPFFAPYQKVQDPSPVPLSDKERLAGEAKRAIVEVVVPSFKKLRDFWVNTYLPACKDDVGAWQLPNGAAMYAYLVRSHTTTKLSPDEVHAIGLREVARIRGEMENVKAKAGFKGSLKEMFAFLRTDPRFYYKDGAELLAAYRALSKRIDPLLVKVFSRLPRTPYGVSAIPDHVAPDTTTAYYREPSDDGTRAGTYFVNLYKPEARPKWEMVALTLHESVPGHHLQIALAMENPDIPKFRKHAEYTAFVEGWGLYAESLGEEMGVYEDPYSKMGQLTYEMWRAVRLVVDTGIHHLKWDRQRAIDFFMENAAKNELDVVNEVDRYISWPGQALAYKIGELKIKELRKKKTAEAGGAAKFDLKAFHDSVLKSGPLPLDVLERQVMSASAH